MIDKIVNHILTLFAALGWMEWLLLWFLALIPMVLFRAHIAPGDGFDLRHLIAEREGECWRISLVKFTHFTAFVIASWVFLHLAINGKLSEYYFWGYMLLSFAPKTVEKYIAKMGAK